ncbi:methionine aminopeptidase [Salmonella enterica subsp. enterica]|uniref:Methionine aminopeptidase n=1 Tax=Salmonella enterica I TaxID=59201 RepID=A0A447TM32_SALET|nr:methionine aminopeptidase [Salmonella enterica subsp. enterica]
MAISIKTSEDIEKMRVAGRLAAEVLEMNRTVYQTGRHHRRTGPYL